MELKKQKKNEILDKIDKEKQIKQEKKIKKVLRKSYFNIIEILKEYCDLREDYYSIIALWTIGTYLHKEFPTYPYLYFNAMKGSGKTRILNLLSHLTYNGKHLISLSEAVLFRTASESTFCIDEFERIGGKEKQALRELLNAGYKKGMTVERAKKTKSKGEEKYVIERFSLYCPIIIANIWGMEDVLSDRCISLVLERSSVLVITRKLELFADSDAVREIKADLGSVRGVLSQKNVIKYIYSKWNKYVQERYSFQNLPNLPYLPNPPNLPNATKLKNLLDKIGNTTLNSRHLELFFPLFVVGNYCGQDVLDEIIKISKRIVKEKKEADIDESRDVSLIEYVSQQTKTGEFKSLKEILKEFREFYAEEEEEGKWINSKWIGKALKRLVLIKEKRRIGGAREIIFDIEKAKEKIKIFKEVDEH